MARRSLHIARDRIEPIGLTMCGRTVDGHTTTATDVPLEDWWDHMCDQCVPAAAFEHDLPDAAVWARWPEHADQWTVIQPEPEHDDGRGG